MKIFYKSFLQYKKNRVFEKFLKNFFGGITVPEIPGDFDILPSSPSKSSTGSTKKSPNSFPFNIFGYFFFLFQRKNTKKGEKIVKRSEKSLKGAKNCKMERKILKRSDKERSNIAKHANKPQKKPSNQTPRVFVFRFSKSFSRHVTAHHDIPRY